MEFLALAFSLLLQSGTEIAHSYYPDADPIKVLHPSPNPGSMPSQLNVLIWNIEKATHGQAWLEDFRRISRARNLVLLQEGMDSELVQSGLNPNQSWIMSQSFRDPDQNSATGVITGSSANPTAVIYRRSPGREPVLKTAKMALFTVYSLPNNSTLLVLNIHALNFVLNSEFYQQIDDVTLFVERYLTRNPKSKVLVAGDFNTWNSGRTQYLKNKMSQLGLTEAAFKYDERILVLDHIFTKGCTIKKTEIHNWIESSDHWPLSAQLDCSN